MFGRFKFRRRIPVAPERQGRADRMSRRPAVPRPETGIRCLHQKPGARARAVLRDERSEGDSRYLGATCSSDGDLLIEGQDIGNAVETAFGYREHEWTWTISNADLPRLAEALDARSDLLRALENRFHGATAGAALLAFLQENKIPFERWSRIGD